MYCRPPQAAAQTSASAEDRNSAFADVRPGPRHRPLCASKWSFKLTTKAGAIHLLWSAQQLRGKFYASCDVLGERSEEAGAFFNVRGEPATVESLREVFRQAR
jgi:hypothetical protein